MPWFGAVFISPEYDAFGPWAMEYEPSYFADPRSKTEPAKRIGQSTLVVGPGPQATWTFG